MIKFLLVAVNSKYIHSNPAVFSLRSYVENTDCKCSQSGSLPDSERQPQFHIEITEYTINQPASEMLSNIYKRKPDMIAFSCYIWNWEMIKRILPELKKILPEVPVWLGGPQVSYDGNVILQSFSSVKGIMRGEGEETYKELIYYYLDHFKRRDVLKEEYAQNNICSFEFLDTAEEKEILSRIKGILFRHNPRETKKELISKEELIATEDRELLDLDLLPFSYTDLSLFQNRIIYYESSRGCPFKCSYCLSSIEQKETCQQPANSNDKLVHGKSVRFKSPEKVKEELCFFLEKKIAQVKFVDRTFNCRHDHAMAVWQFIKERDNGVTNFHFEISADILTDEEIVLLQSMRPGLIQLEIGVQSTHKKTLDSIYRNMDFQQVKKNVAALGRNQNIHIHLDLIAGLPYEDYDTFADSFNEVYACRPEQLQLGFLKVLPGAPIRQQAAEYGIIYENPPPYQVLFTKWVSYAEMQRLQEIEEMLELYYNSGQFAHTLQVLETAFSGPFQMYEQLADFYREKGYFLNSPARAYRYQVLLDFACAYDKEKEACYQELLTFDLYLRENVKSRPAYAADLTPYRDFIRDFYQQEEETGACLPEYAGYLARQLIRMTHMEVFYYPVYEKAAEDKIVRRKEPVYVLFDYQKKDAVTRDAAIRMLHSEIHPD